MNIGQMLYSTGAIGMDQYQTHKNLVKEEIIKGYSTGSTVATLLGTSAVAAAMFGRMHEGLLYSFGAEPIVGEKGYGYVRSIGNNSADNLKGIVSGKANFYKASNQHFFNSVGAAEKSVMEKGVMSLHATKRGVGVMTQNAFNTILPAGMTLYFAADAYANDGMTGLGKYMVADVLGNFYGTKAALNTLEVTNETKANSFLNVADDNKLKNKELLQRIAPIGGSGMIGRMIPALGGIVGATVGMELGASIGSAVTSLINNGGPSDTSGAIAGGLLGTIAGASFGASAMSGIPSALVAGIGIAATTSIVSRNMDAIKSGFQTQRGLNFAGETAAYFTQNAVTMRERAVQSMHKSNMNARSAFGQEATLMHMNRDMFSQYKRPLR